jgi:hypothetical protein
MVFKQLFMTLLIGHILGDFYFQKEAFASSKDRDLRRLFIHGLVYLVSTTSLPLLLFAFSQTLSGWAWLLLVPMSHLAIDWLMGRLAVSIELMQSKRTHAIILDQAMHVVIVIVVAYICATECRVALTEFGHRLSSLYYTFGIPITLDKLVMFICIALVLWKPANVVIQSLLSSIVDTSDVDDVTIDGLLSERSTGKVVRFKADGSVEVFEGVIELRPRKQPRCQTKVLHH